MVSIRETGREAMIKEVSKTGRNNKGLRSKTGAVVIPINLTGKVTRASRATIKTGRNSKDLPSKTGHHKTGAVEIPISLTGRVTSNRETGHNNKDLPSKTGHSKDLRKTGEISNSHQDKHLITAAEIMKRKNNM